MKAWMARIDEVLSRLTVVDYDLLAAERYAEIRSGLTKRGFNIGEADMQIAACALNHGCTVVTANTKDFSRIRDLPVHAVK
jgi:tRNA(fMet)-specific endonuclease VapC